MYSGGLCDEHGPHPELSPHNLSLNTGVVSLSRAGRPTSEAVAALSFSHEVHGNPHVTCLKKINLQKGLCPKLHLALPTIHFPKTFF